jgi:hypothetical protein
LGSDGRCEDCGKVISFYDLTYERRKETEEYMETFPDDPRGRMFPYSSLTKDLDIWTPHPDWGLVGVLLMEYAEVISKIREANVLPWEDRSTEPPRNCRGSGMLQQAQLKSQNRAGSAK